jgi:hypothetical protein
MQGSGADTAQFVFVNKKEKRRALTSCSEMDNQSSHGVGVGMDLSRVVASPSYGKAVEMYRKAVSPRTPCSARGMARELFPNGLRDAVRSSPSPSGGATRRSATTGSMR